MYCCVFFFFKQKTAYEIVDCDWSSDVCSSDLLQATGQITVIVQDGASFHRSRETQKHWSAWQEQGLFLFFLPPQSPQMNRIEEEGLHLKRHELSAQLFEDEYDLAIALIETIEKRGQRRGYPVERFRFNSG